MCAKFRQLPDVELSEEAMHTPLELGPPDLCHGTLSNGMRYYVRTCRKPKERAAIALAVRVGSVLEEDEEQGVAHIVEHLAFNATEAFTNHDIVRFLESIGAEFGACQNAYTSADETVYELSLPTDNPELLERGLSVFAEFAAKIRCADTDLAKERGAVMEEWRSGKDSRGRTAEAHWKLLLAGSKYAERLPIGQERIIQTVPAAVVRGFYERWYRPEHMGIVAVGDFEDTQAVVAMLRKHLEPVTPRSALPAPSLPKYPLVPHSVPRFSAFTDRESQQAAVHVSFLHPRPPVTTPAEFVHYLALELYQLTLNNRLFKLSRQQEPPFYSASVSPEQLTATIQSHVVSASTSDGGLLRALRALLTELARVRLHGFSEREVATARAQLMSEVESSYLERDQSYNTDVRDEYVRHFLHNEFVVGQEMEARLSKTLLPRVGPVQLQALAEKYRTSASCVVKAVSHRRAVTEAQLRQVVAEVDSLEAAGQVEPWAQDDAPALLLATEPQPGQVVERREHATLGARELRLSNGLRVCYKCTDHLEDQVLLSGFAAGGLTEVPREQFRTASMATVIAAELGYLGHKPEVLADLLSGKRVEVRVSEAAFWRTFGGEQSPVDLETALQLIHTLFTHRVEPKPRELDTCMQLAREAIIAQIRNPLQAFSKRVRFIHYGRCYFFEPMSLADLGRLDPAAACAHFNDAFRNPAEFTVCLTGNLDEEQLEGLLERYLASIPATGQPAPRSPTQVTPLDFQFPAQPVVEDVRVAMLMPQAQALITLPVEIGGDPAVDRMHEVHWLGCACQLLQMKLMEVLRFTNGDVYSVAVQPFFGATAPSSTGPVRGDVSIGFSCDPLSTHRLVQAALDELERLQNEGPTDTETATVVTLERRSYEEMIQENSYWQEMMVTGYQSRTYQTVQDLDETFRRRMAAREAVLGAMDAPALRAALRRLLPCPARSRYTAVTLTPQPPLLARVRQAAAAVAPTTPHKAAVWLVGVTALSAAAYGVARYWQRRR